MENEIMNNEMAVEEVAEVATVDSRRGLKALAVTGLALVVGGIVYKKLIKPAIAKRKAKKVKAELVEGEFEEAEVEEVDSEENIG